jgi:2-polyprenylphenol 6-hydroxylase
MATLTDGLQWLFGAQSSRLATLRNAGLGMTDKLPWLKKLLIARAIG